MLTNLPLVSRNPVNFILQQPNGRGRGNTEFGVPRKVNANGFNGRINYQLDGSNNTQSDRAGIRRYGSAHIPMDETLTEVALDASNRPYLIWKVNFSKPKLGTMDTELFKEWFQAFAQLGGLTLHVWNHYGDNNHHIVESCFKGVARALRVACEVDPRQTTAIPSTKGVL